MAKGAKPRPHHSDAKITTTFLLTKVGVWITEDEGEKAAYEGLETASDRAAAIVAGSMIDLHLEGAIRFQLLGSMKAQERLFDGNAPLGTFSAKIDLANVLGIIGDDAYRDLHLIREVRNDFAHNLRINDFNTPKVRDKLKQLRLVDTQIGDQRDEPGSHIISLKPGTPGPRVSVRDYATRRLNPRDRYLLSASLFSVVFGIKSPGYRGMLI